MAQTLVAVAGLVGCGDNHAVAPPDGGDVGVAGDGGDRCTGTAPACDGLAVKECSDNVFGKVLYDCTNDGACIDGRCMSVACAAIEHDRLSFAGCRFYTVQADNVESDAAAATSFLITNPGSEPATVSIEQMTFGSWGSKVPMTVVAGGTLRLPIADLEVKDVGRHDGGLRLNSDRPVTVAQIESDDIDGNARSSGGTMLLPARVLGTNHMVMTYPQAQTPEIAALPGSPNGAGRLLIVGTQPATTVTLTLAKTSSGATLGTTSMLMGGDMYSFTLNDGEVFQLVSVNAGDDLSGTKIESTLPVAVFSGNMTTTYARTAEGLHSPDMAHEQMPPVYAWSNTYVAAALPPQEGGACDTLLGQGRSLWRLLVWGKPSHVEIIGPSGPIAVYDPFEPGQVMELTMTGDFYVTSTEPLLMTQGMDCEPSLSLAISADRFLNDLTFAVLPGFDQVVAVARKGKSTVALDGIVIPGSMFRSAGGGYEVARVPVGDCPPSEQVCTHRLQGSFGMTMRGMDIAASYALTAPVWSGCIDDFDPSCHG